MNSYEKLYTLFIERRGARSKRRNIEKTGITRRKNLPTTLVTKERGGPGTGREFTAGHPGYLSHTYSGAIDPKGVRDNIQANMRSKDATGPRTGRHK